MWKEINVKYAGLSGSRQYDVADDVYHYVVGTINSIVKQCGPIASPQTRYNGLSVLRRIGKTIALFGNSDVVGHEIQKSVGQISILEDAMLDIMNAMTTEERAAIAEDDSTNESLWPKLDELCGLGESYCIFEKLGDVVDKLAEALGEEGAHYEEDDGYDNDDDDGDGEDEEDGEDEKDEENYEDYYNENRGPSSTDNPDPHGQVAHL